MDLKKDLMGLKSKLENIEKGFNEKLTDVSDKEQRDKRIDEKISEIVQAKTQPAVHLNIGGKIFATKLSTLLSCKDSIFYKNLSQYIDNESNIPEEIFYDRSYAHFDIILNYLRTNTFNIKSLNRFEKEDIREEVEFYGLSSILDISKRQEYDIEWDQSLSKSGACTVDSTEKRLIKIHSNTCYTHFVTNKLWTNEDFQIELEVAVTQSDSYLYVGIYNSSYSLSGSCGCCNPTNCVYIQCDGSVHTNSTKTNNNQVAWQSQKIIIGMKVFLETQKNVYFYFPEKNDLEIGPYKLTGSNFRIYSGHCNNGNGTIRILDCWELKE